MPKAATPARDLRIVDLPDHFPPAPNPAFAFAQGNRNLPQRLRVLVLADPSIFQTGMGGRKENCQISRFSEMSSGRFALADFTNGQTGDFSSDPAPHGRQRVLGPLGLEYSSRPRWLQFRIAMTHRSTRQQPFQPALARGRPPTARGRCVFQWGN